MLLQLLVLLLTALFCTNSLSNAASSSVTPLSYVARLGQPNKATFTCTVHGANYVKWEINDQPDLIDKLRERDRRGIETDSHEIPGNFSLSGNSSLPSYLAVLKLSASAVNGYTEILCWAVVRDGSARSVSSEMAVFQVQGLLDEPRNVTSVQLNATHSTLHWLPPHTLNITDIEPDISGYTVCVFIPFLSDLCMNGTTLWDVVLPHVNMDGHVTITTWNIVGRGRQADITIEGCEVHSIEVDEAVVQMRGEDEISVLITLSNGLSPVAYNQSTMCFCLYNITLVVNDSSTYLGPFPPTTYHPHNVSVEIPGNPGIVHNDRYTAVISCIKDDHSNATSTLNATVLFDTFDTQEVKVNVVNENLTLQVSCEFALGSQARGCYLNISSNNSQTEQPNNQVSRHVTRRGAVSIWEESLNNTGSYHIYVYDWEKDGSVDVSRPVYSTVVDVVVNSSSGDHNMSRYTTDRESLSEGVPTQESHQSESIPAPGSQGLDSPMTLIIAVLACCSVAVLVIVTIVLLVICCTLANRRMRLNAQVHGCNTKHNPSSSQPRAENALYPIYEQIVETKPHSPTQAQTPLDLQGTYGSDYTDALTLNSNVAYACPQQPNRAYGRIGANRVGRGPLPTLPLETATHRERDQENGTAGVYETILQ